MAVHATCLIYLTVSTEILETVITIFTLYNFAAKPDYLVAQVINRVTKHHVHAILASSVGSSFPLKIPNRRLATKLL